METERRAWWMATGTLFGLLVLVPRLFQSLDPLGLLDFLFAADGILYVLGAGALAGWVASRGSPVTPVPMIARACAIVAGAGLLLLAVNGLARGMPDRWLATLIVGTAVRTVVYTALAGVAWWGLQSMQVARSTVARPA